MNFFLGTTVVLPYGVERAAGKLRRGIAAVISTFAISFSVAGLTVVGADALEAQTIRLAALGDSLTQGYGLQQGDGLVPQLQSWLRGEGHDVEVLNAGVSGDTTAGGLSRMDWTLADTPDAMMVALGGNDLLRGIDPATSRANLSAILERLRDESIPALLVGLPAPGNYGPEYRAAFEAMYTELAEEFDTMLYPNLLQPISDKQAAGMSFSELMQDDHIHPNSLGVSLIVEALGPVVSAFLDTLRSDP